VVGGDKKRTEGLWEKNPQHAVQKDSPSVRTKHKQVNKGPLFESLVSGWTCKNLTPVKGRLGPPKKGNGVNTGMVRGGCTLRDRKNARAPYPEETRTSTLGGLVGGGRNKKVGSGVRFKQERGSTRQDFKLISRTKRTFAWFSAGGRIVK